MPGPENVVPPPLAVVQKGWFGSYTLTLPEVEAYHLRLAAKMAGAVLQIDREAQMHHLEEAFRARHWYRCRRHTPVSVQPRPERSPASAASAFSILRSGGKPW